MNQRVAQTPDFWKTQFQVTPDAVEALYNVILEAGEPYSIDSVGLFFVKYALEEEERKIRSELQHGKTYQPQHDYQVDDKIIFPNFGYAVGTVIAVRPGYNPVDEDFSVLEVVFEAEGGISANFAANLRTAHALLNVNGDTTSTDHSAAVQKLYGQYQHLIRPKAEQALTQHSDFVELNQTWFLQSLLAEIQDGLLNIVDAAIDINNGPLNVDALIEQIELQGTGQITEALRFSVNYRLEKDERFINVGTEDIVLWYLNRLKPEYVNRPPRRLKESDQSFDVSLLNSEQRALLAEIDDEATPVEFTKAFDEDASSATLILNYHHRRLGTLPVLPIVNHLLPPANGRVVALQLVDGRTGDSILCWYVSQGKYILGLADWYVRHQLPVGIVLTLAKTDEPLKFVIDYLPQRAHQEYVRVASAKGGQLAFEEKRRRFTCRYDQLMIIGEEGSDRIDALWEQIETNNPPISDLLAQILPELMRLSSQGAVHLKTIYSAINVLKRCSPGLLMQELILGDRFISMGHGYWTYKS